MFLSGKSVRKLRKLRPRAWLVGALVASGCLYWGGRLALAHNRPAMDHLPDNLPKSVLYARTDYQSWLPTPSQADRLDVLVDPRIHAEEEVCNQEGLYPSRERDFTLAGSGWNYSSLDGVQRAEAAPAPASVTAKQLGWDGKTPIWGMVSPQGLSEWMPLGLTLSPEVKAVEGRMWPEQRRGQLVVHLQRELQLSDQPALGSVWKHLPAAPIMGCLRKEVAQAVFRSRPGLAQRLMNSSENWVAASVDTELTPEDLSSGWNRLQMGWLPMALWGDFAATQVHPARDLGMASDKEGTLYTVGMAAATGTATAPWEGWKAPGKPDNWVGAGRLHWHNGDSLQRVEWVAQVEPGQVVVTFNWSAAATQAEPEIATMGPDLEHLYTFHPNVIAGR